MPVTDFVSTWNNDLLTVPFAPLGLIAMPGCEELGQKVNNWLMKWYEQQEALEDTPLFSLMGANRHDFLIEAHCPRFGTGEGKGMIKNSVRGYDIYILTDIGAYNVTYKMYGREVPMSPDDHYQDLKRIIAAIGGKARRITVIMPMLYEGRQHKRAARESLDCAIMLQELVNMGVTNILTFDAHDPRVANAIPLSGFDNVTPSYQMLKAMVRSMPDVVFDKDHIVMISPDEGAMGRCMYYSETLGVDIGMFYKRRDYSRVVNGKNPILEHRYLGDSLEGKDAIIVDDMISSGGSLLEVAKHLKEDYHARRVCCFATFGLFTDGFRLFDEAYANGLIDHIFTTNLTYHDPDIYEKEWHTEVNMCKYVSYLIDTLNHDGSISSILSPNARIQNVVRKYKNGEQI